MRNWQHHNTTARARALHALVPVSVPAVFLHMLAQCIQLKNMVQPHRALATFVYLAAIAGTLAVAFSVCVCGKENSIIECSCLLQTVCVLPASCGWRQHALRHTPGLHAQHQQALLRGAHRAQHTHTRHSRNTPAAHPAHLCFHRTTKVVPSPHIPLPPLPKQLQMSGVGAFVLVLILLIIQFLAFIWVRSCACVRAGWGQRNGPEGLAAV